MQGWGFVWTQEFSLFSWVVGPLESYRSELLHVATRRIEEKLHKRTDTEGHDIVLVISWRAPSTKFPSGIA